MILRILPRGISLLLISLGSCLAAPADYWRFEGEEGGVCASADNSANAEAPLIQDEGQRQPVFSSEKPKLPNDVANRSSMEFRAENRTALAAADAKVADFGEGQPFTVECWINPKAYSEKEDVLKTILHKRGGDTTDMQAPKPGFQLLLKADHHIIFSAMAADGAGKALTSKTEIPLYEWTHVAVTRDAEGKFILYINGSKEDESRGPLPAALTNDGVLTVGANRFMMATPPFWEGLIDELRVSDSALASEQLLYAPQ